MESDSDSISSSDDDDDDEAVMIINSAIVITAYAIESDINSKASEKNGVDHPKGKQEISLVTLKLST